MAVDAEPLVLNEEIIGHLGDGDTVDTYQVAVTDSSKSVILDIRPSDSQFRYRLTVKNRKGKRIASKASRGGSLKLQLKPVGDAGEIFVEVKSNNPKLETRFTSYSFAASHGERSEGW